MAYMTSFEKLAPTTLVCPLDNSSVNNTSLSDYYVCNTCQEMLELEELVTRATHETWAAYLTHGKTDTQPESAPLERLSN